MLVSLGERVPFLGKIIRGLKSTIKVFQTAKGEMGGVKSVSGFKVTKNPLTDKPSLPIGGVEKGVEKGAAADPITNMVSSMLGK
jgi:hypothetical protein